MSEHPGAPGSPPHEWKKVHANEAEKALEHPLVKDVIAEFMDNVGIPDEGLPHYGIRYVASVARAETLGFDPDLLRLTPEEAMSNQLRLAAEAALRGVPVRLIERDVDG